MRGKIQKNDQRILKNWIQKTKELRVKSATLHRISVIEAEDRYEQFIGMPIVSMSLSIGQNSNNSNSF